MAQTIFDKVRDAIYTEDRKIWLDPEDAAEMVADVVTALGLDPEEPLRTELALTEDDRDVMLLAIQRLIWPPSPHYFLHDRPHVEIEIGQRTQGGGWQGELRCKSGCGRAWRVNQASTEEAVHGALAQAHEEYRSGRTTAVNAVGPSGDSRRVSLAQVLGRAEYVEVQDRRVTAEWTVPN
jgi:hypothetical protein